VFLGDLEARSLQPSAAREEHFAVDEHMGERLPLRILLAEDNQTNQKLALLLLERLGYRADVVENGREVLEALRHHEYDTVLMDVQMPELDGIEATRLIRGEFSPERQPHIIAVTANAMRKDRDVCVAAGMNDYISKPIEIREVVESLAHARALLDLKQAPNRAAAPAPAASAPATVPPAKIDLAAAAAETGDVIDPAALKRLQNNLGKRQVMLPGLIGSFLTDAAKLHGQACQALERGEPDALRRAVHTLKSSSANFGAMTLSGLCRDLEQQVAAGELGEAPGRLADIEQEYERAKAALSGLRSALERQLNGGGLP